MTTENPVRQRRDGLSIQQKLLYRLDGLSDQQYGLMLLGPLFTAIGIALLYPLVRTVYISLFKLNITSPFRGREFVGLGNYLSILQSPVFQYAVGFTLFFAIVTVAFELLLGLICGLLLSQEFRGRGLFRTAILLPWAIPLAVQGLLWKFIFNSNYGLANSLLADLGLIDQYIYWLGNADTATFAIIFNDIWKTFPFMALLVLAGIQTIDANLFRAAKVDGAGRWERFRYIILPLIKNHILVALIFRTIFALRVFGIIYIMTGGGPADSTMSVSVLTVRRTFDQLKFGEGAAIGVLTVLIMIPFIGLYIHFYEGDAA